MSCEQINVARKTSLWNVAVAEVAETIPSFEQLSREANDVWAKYDSQKIADITAKLNEKINSIVNFTSPNVPVPGFDGLTPEEIPVVVERGAITPTETAIFIENVSYDPDILIADLADNPAKPLRMLEFFLTENEAVGISGGFCGAFSSVVGSFNALASDAAATIGDLTNYSDNNVPRKLGNALEMAQEIIDAIVKNASGQLDNIVDRALDNVLGGEYELSGLANKMSDELAMVRQIFDQEHVKAMKDGLDRLLSEMAGQYESIDAEILSYLLFRVCGILQEVHRVFRAPMEHLQGMVREAENAQRVYDASYGFDGVIRGNVSGLVIPSRSAVIDIRNGARARIAAQVSDTGVVGGGSIPRSRVKAISPQITPEIILKANNWNVVKEGGRYVKVENDRIALAPSVMNMGVDYPDAGERDGWEKVNRKVWAMAYMLSERLGRKLTVTSAYRSPQKNASLSGAARNSFHMSGLALDIITIGIDPVEFIKHISILGASGIGYYHGQNFIHFDVGTATPRYWFKGSLPSSVKEALLLHMSNGSANGPFWVDDKPDTIARGGGR